MENNIKSILAKTDGTTLYDHTIEVLNLVKILSWGIEDEDFYNRCKTAAVLHDIGKCTESFQKAVKADNVVPSGIKHNIVSWAFALGWLPHNKFLTQITDAVLYHHSVPFERNISAKCCDILSSLTSEEMNLIVDFYDAFKGEIIPREECCYDTDDADYTMVSLYRSTEFVNPAKIDMESQSLLLRSILVCADRIASSCDEKYDHEKIRNNDIEYIYAITHNSHLDIPSDININKILEFRYDMNRLKLQKEIAEEAIYSYLKGTANTAMVNASAGFGKTLLGMISILKRKRKTVWCVPTREIAISTYESIKKEIEKMEIPMSVCLFYANEIQDTYNNESTLIEDYDITVSVIDSMLSRFHNNNTGHLMYSLLCGDIIFDEYHNIVTDNALFAVFSLLWNTRMMHTNGYSMFLSATPLSPYHAGIKTTEKIKSFNPPKYKGDVKINFHYIDKVEKVDKFLPNSFIICNTVAQAQNMYRYLKNNGYTEIMLYHAQFENDDLKALRNKLFCEFGKGTPVSNKIVVCTGIIGTGLDISAENIYDYTLSPSDTLQRVCGRASRFGEYDEINYFLCDFKDDEIEKIAKGNSTFIRNVYSESLRSKFINGMKGNDGKTFTKDELYGKVEKFNNLEKIVSEINAFYKEKLANSRKNLNKITLKKCSVTKKDDIRYTSKKATLRGDGHEVFIAVPYEGKDKAEYSIFTMDSERVRQIEKEPDSIDIRKFRMAFYKGNNMYQKSWKYKYGISGNNDCNFDVCVDLAYCSETPLPVYNMAYSHEYGAYCKNS